MDFKVLTEKDKDGFFVAMVPSLPGCISQGQNEEIAFANVREAIQLHMKSLATEKIVPSSRSSLERIVTVNL
jgi:predicted RNase H-like HicB family nuclease